MAPSFGRRVWMGVAMTDDILAYHRLREQHCREMAEIANDPDIRRRHEELARLHAGRAAQYEIASD